MMKKKIRGLACILAGGFIGVGALTAIYTFSPSRPAYTPPHSSAPQLPNRSDLKIVRPPRDYETASSIDINGDTSSDFYDVDAFVKEFEACGPRADFNRDGFIDFYDVDDFVKTYESGCS